MTLGGSTFSYVVVVVDKVTPEAAGSFCRSMMT
jgi:hypothetical protein